MIVKDVIEKLNLEIFSAPEGVDRVVKGDTPRTFSQMLWVMQGRDKSGLPFRLTRM